MPFDSKGVYKLTNVGGNFLEPSMIAIAPRMTTTWSGPLAANAPFVEFYVDNDVNFGHAFACKILLEDNGTIDVQDLEKKGDDGGAVIWRFEPLTIALWETMRDQIGGFDELRAQINNDEVLRLYYIASFAGDEE